MAEKHWIPSTLPVNHKPLTIKNMLEYKEYGMQQHIFTLRRFFGNQTYARQCIQLTCSIQQYLLLAKDF